VQHTPNAAYTECRIHRVQHTPSAAYTKDCLSSLHSHDFELTPECGFSFRRTSLPVHRHQPVLFKSFKGKVTSSHSHGYELTNRGIESQNLARLPSTASRSKCISELARSRPHSASLSSLNLGLQLHLQTRSITASKCISKLARSRRSRPPSASLSSLNLGLQVHLQTRSIMASKCISEFPPSRPPSASPNSLDHGLGVHL
jgi:hypothetical protein